MKLGIIGSGAEGTGLAGLLAQEEIELLLLADYSEAALERAQKCIAMLGDGIKAKEIKYCKVDAGNIDNVCTVIHGLDAVINAILPKFNIPIMKACIREKVNYTDLLTMPDAPGTPEDETFSAQMGLDKEFKEAGITAVPYVGISGGWVSLVAKKALDKFDTVDEVMLYFFDDADTDELLPAILPSELIGEYLSQPGSLVNIDGELQTVDFIDTEEYYDFPGPSGKHAVYTNNCMGDISIIPDFAGKPIHRCEAKNGSRIGKYETKDWLLKVLLKATLKQGFEKSDINIVDAMAENMQLPSMFSKFLAEGKIKDETFTMVVQIRGTIGGKKYLHKDWSVTTLENSLAHLPWAGPNVFSTIGGTPVSFMLALGSRKMKQTGVIRVADFENADEVLEKVASYGHLLGSETVEIL